MIQYEELYVYVDGSYSTSSPTIYAGAYILIDPTTNQIIYEASGCGNKAVNMRNVAGELTATMRGTQMALRLARKAVIFYDYQGIEAWITGEWKARKPETQAYYNFMLKYVYPVKRIQFVKVKAHSGNMFNEMVDDLSKEALLSRKSF